MLADEDLPSVPCRTQGGQGRLAVSPTSDEVAVGDESGHHQCPEMS